MRVRFAPSPTGNLHIGTLRAALFNWLYAKHHKGSFVLRIEDTDLQRSEKQYETNIFAGLSWLGLTVDEGPEQSGSVAPYRQSERIEHQLYQKAAMELIDKGLAYYCFLTDEDITKKRAEAKEKGTIFLHPRTHESLTKQEINLKINNNEPYTIRFKMNAKKIITFKDMIRNPIDFDCSIISDFVILKSDGSPSYNFAVVVDDSSMKITHVIRGEDHISNMPKQLALYEALGHKTPDFAHLPMILGPDKSKLSKRHGATAVTDYRDQGFLPEALLNYLALLGWSPKDEQELLSSDEIIEQFGMDRVNKSNAVFDIQKLTWMNGQYIRKLVKEELFNKTLPYLAAEKKAAFNKLSIEQQQNAFLAVQDNLDTLLDINRYIDVFLDSDADIQLKQKEIKWNKTDITVLKQLEIMLNEKEFKTVKEFTSLLELICEKTGFGKGKVFKPIRFALTGMGSGPHISELCSFFGTEIIINRVSFCLGLMENENNKSA
tara:strand:- start:2155 stop:3624 length:1470 start_codon:yes stop_codon:yes gene_type:complete